MNLINIKTGKANANASCSECYVFFVPRPLADGANCTETFLGKAARELKGRADAPFREHGSAVVIPSLTNIPPEIGGSFASASYQVKDGVILKVTATKRSSWNSTMQRSTVFVRVRETAAHRCLRFDPAPNNALTMEWLGIQGRFDVITLAEAEAFGAHLTPMTRKLAEIRDDGIFQNQVLSAEEAAPVGFVPVGAEGKMVPVVKRRRKVDSI